MSTLIVILRIITLAIALFFAGVWTFGVVTRPEFRLKSTVAGIVYWWFFIVAALIGLFSPFHLWWLMPAALIFMVGLSGSMMSQLKPFSTSTLVGAGIIPLGLCSALASYVS